MSSVICPHCGSTDVIKFGKSRATAKGVFQRYKCKSCMSDRNPTKPRLFNGEVMGRPHNLENNCPRCGGLCKRNGTREGKHQKWLCIDPGCRYAWESDLPRKPVPELLSDTFP